MPGGHFQMHIFVRELAQSLYKNTFIVSLFNCFFNNPSCIEISFKNRTEYI